MRKGSVLVAIAALLSGCASYEINGTVYRSGRAALRAQSDLIEAQLAKIGPLERAGGSVLVSLPPDRELAEPPFAYKKLPRGTPSYRFFVTFAKRDAVAVAQALSKTGAFDSVELSTGASRGACRRFVLRNTGQGWVLEDSLTRQSRQLGLSGLKDLTAAAQDAAVGFLTLHPSSEPLPCSEQASF